MVIVIRILLTVVLHAGIFICYPDTGPNGKIFLAVSLLLWTGFLMFMHVNLKFIKLISGFLGLIFGLAFFTIMFISVALTLPQDNKISVLDKLQNKQYPDKKTMARGIAKLGIKKWAVKYGEIVKDDAKTISDKIKGTTESKINKALK